VTVPLVRGTAGADVRLALPAVVTAAVCAEGARAFLPTEAPRFGHARAQARPG
jgi:hypothetical protein